MTLTKDHRDGIILAYNLAGFTPTDKENAQELLMYIRKSLEVVAREIIRIEKEKNEIN